MTHRLAAQTLSDVKTLQDWRETDADVPDSFLAVQWTRLPGGETPAAFCERVQKRLVGELGPRPPPGLHRLGDGGSAYAIWVLVQAGQASEARERARTVIERYPAQSYMRGYVLVALGDFPAAVPCLQISPRYRGASSSTM